MLKGHRDEIAENSLAAVAGYHHRLGADRPGLHVQLLALCPQLRQDIQLRAELRRDAGLGDALLAPLGRALAARLLADAPVPPGARAAPAQPARPRRGGPRALARAPRRLPLHRVGARSPRLHELRVPLVRLQRELLLQ